MGELVRLIAFGSKALAHEAAACPGVVVYRHVGGWAVVDRGRGSLLRRSAVDPLAIHVAVSRGVRLLWRLVARTRHDLRHRGRITHGSLLLTLVQIAVEVPAPVRMRPLGRAASQKNCA